MVSHFILHLTLSLFHEIYQKVDELHCDEVQVSLGILKQIAPALNQCIYCLLKRRIQQEKHVPQLKEPQ
jgi:hypothetical protein